MIFDDAQKNMNDAYFGGGTGGLASGLIWSVAGIVAVYSSPQTSMLTLFFGGMVIYPLSLFLSKLLQRSGRHKVNNPLGKLALESTAILFVGLFIAFSVAKLRVDWFYPIMLMIIGVRYLVFQTLYGIKLYWLLGATLTIVGVFCLLFGAPFITGALLGGTFEIIFSLFILYYAKVKE